MPLSEHYFLIRALESSQSAASTEAESSLLSWQHRHCCSCQRSFTPSPRAPSIPHSSFCVYRACPYMARSFQRAAAARQKHKRLLSTPPHQSMSAAQYKHGSSRLEACEDENRPPGQVFRNLAIKNPMVSLSALWGREAAAPLWSQLSSGRNLWSRRSCSGDSPAPCMPSAPIWGS